MTDPGRRRVIGRAIGAAIAVAAGAARPALALARTRSVIRICGSPQMAPLIDRWTAAFAARNPSVAFAIDLRGTATAQFGLHMGTADIAASGREIFPYEYYGIYRRSQLLTVQIPVAVGSFAAVGRSNAIGVFVHRDNPLRQLSLSDLDAIFGAERTGGWQAMEWNEEVRRDRSTLIRTWGQLGLAGAWADRPIVPYGPPALHPGGVSFFQSRVMGGADTVNERLREYSDRRAMLAALSQDPAGIGYAGLGYRTAAVRTVALGATAAGPAVVPSPASVADLSYPLARLAYLDIAPDDVHGDPSPPPADVAAFLRFVLAEGQRIIAGTEYYPLPRTVRDRAASRIPPTGTSGR